MKPRQIASISVLVVLFASIAVLTRQPQVSLISDDDSARLRLGSYREPVLTTADIDQPSRRLMISHWRGTVSMTLSTAPLPPSVTTALNHDRSQIVFLDLRNVDHSGCDWLRFEEMPRLKYLRLPMNSPLQQVQSAFEVPSLVALDVSKTDVSALQLNDPIKLLDLQVLNLSYSKSSAENLSKLSHLPKLEEIILNGDADDVSIEAMCQREWMRLRRIRVRHSSIGPSGLSAILAQKGVEEVDLMGCSRITDMCIPKFIAAKSLRRIVIGSTGITPDGIAQLKREFGPGVVDALP